MILLMAVLSVGQPFAFSQLIGDTISQTEVQRIMAVLAADSMKGRGNGRPELLTATVFIGNEFRKNNLLPLVNATDYYLPFRPFGGSKNATGDELYWNDQKVSHELFVYYNKTPGAYPSKDLADFTIIKLDSFLLPGVLDAVNSDTSSLLLWTDRKQPGGINFLPEKIDIPAGGIKRNILLVYATTAPEKLSLVANINFYNAVQYNVVAMLKGRSKANEIILISSHYDHEGVFSESQGDSILNGANDNASGVTGMLLLAQYFALRNDNERTLVFCAFSGEELGLKGSYEFSSMIDADRIVAGINIEMIGVRQFQKRAVFITGQEYSDLPAILGKGLRKAGIRVIREPDETKQLFRRSDNYPFAEKGVPAHTIMTSDDDDRCYHQPCDELDRIDIPNMTAVIKGMATAMLQLVSGDLTPRRPNPRLYERERPSNFRIGKWRTD